MHHPQTVHYTELYTPLVVGQCAYVQPVDHPSPYVTNTSPVRTSPVRWIAKDGHVFHTENSRYVPVVGSEELLNEHIIR